MTVAEFTPRLRNRIAMAIQESDLPQKEVAARLHVSPATVSAWVRGHREPSPSQLVELAAVTGCPWLLDLRGLARVTEGPSELRFSSSGWMMETAGQAA